MAGLIAAKDNSLGMRGVAPGARIYGYNFLMEDTFANAADAMSRNAAATAISNNSWGPIDSSRPEPASELWETAVKYGVTTGYGGKGVFYAFAAGNGGAYDYSTLDEFSNYYAVTAVCAVGHDDIRSRYSESGANLWVCGPSSSGRDGHPRIATTDNKHRYRGTFGGTSAAAPIVSGVVALIREVNNTLTWRDVKLILAASARKNDPDNTGWEQGALKYGSTTDRYNFNHEYGFGMVDAKAAVDLAPGWTNVRDLREITSESGGINLRIPDRWEPEVRRRCGLLQLGFNLPVALGDLGLVGPVQLQRLGQLKEVLLPSAPAATWRWSSRRTWSWDHAAHHGNHQPERRPLCGVRRVCGGQRPLQPPLIPGPYR